MVLDRTVFKPFRMIVQEPMLAVITLYSELCCAASRSMANSILNSQCPSSTASCMYYIRAYPHEGSS